MQFSYICALWSSTPRRRDSHYSNIANINVHIFINYTYIATVTCTIQIAGHNCIQYTVLCICDLLVHFFCLHVFSYLNVHSAVNVTKVNFGVIFFHLVALSMLWLLLFFHIQIIITMIAATRPLMLHFGKQFASFFTYPFAKETALVCQYTKCTFFSLLYK